MAKDTYYFSHDYNARNDEKILSLRIKYGYEGYGLYWALIEAMSEASNYKLSLDKIEALSISIHYDSEKLKKFIDDCINNFKLFLSNSEFFWSKSLLKRMKKKKDKSKKMSENAKNRWKTQENNNTEVMQLHSKTDATVMHKRKGKYINKNKEIKEKDKDKEEDKEKEKDSQGGITSTIPFSTFYDLYDKKTGNKSKLEKKWNNLTDEERQKIIEYIPKYKKAQPDKQYRKNPETFLNSRGWEDELIYADKSMRETESKNKNEIDWEKRAEELVKNNLTELKRNKQQLNGTFSPIDEAERLIKTYCKNYMIGCPSFDLITVRKINQYIDSS